MHISPIQSPPSLRCGFSIFQRLLVAFACLGAGAGVSTPSMAAEGTATDLKEGFVAPPREARPLVMWHWLNGTATKEGITADLEAMQRVGLGGAEIFFVQQSLFNSDGSEVKGDAVFMTPHWREMVMHAITEAHRLDLELTMLTCEGWGEAGGQWVTPADSMQKVIWTETHVDGGQRVAVSVERPVPESQYYEDIAVLAFPTPPGDDHRVEPILTASQMTMSEPQLNSAESDAPLFSSEESDPPLFKMPLPMPGKPQWLQLDYGAPRPFSSIHISINEMRDVADPDRWEDSVFLDAEANAALRTVPEPHYWELQASDDGRQFRPIGRISTHGTTSFPETMARYFRISMPVPPPLQRALPFTGHDTGPMEVTEISLGGPRIDRPETRAGKYIDWTVRNFSGATIPPGNVIPLDRIVNLTGQTHWDAPPGQWTILRIGHASTGANVGPAVVRGLEANKLSRAAVERHLNDGMVGTMLKEAGPLVGTTLKGLACDSWERGFENWSPEMQNEFRQRHGYTIDPWLVALTGRVVEGADESERFLWDFRRTIADLLAENFYGTLRDFAHEHGMNTYAEATGHGLPTIADQLLCKGRVDVPMGEFWAGRGDVDDTKEAASAAHIYGKKLAAAEAFTAEPHLASWTRDPYVLKPEGDLRFCLGINQLVFHRNAQQPWLDRQPGVTMGHWGTEFDRTNTWWEPSIAWVSYLSRCQYLLQRGSFVADVCYFYGEDAPVDFGFARLDPRLPAGFDFDVCNVEVLQTMTVNNGRITLPSGMSYRVLVLPVHDRMTPDVLRAVERLVQDGATVVGPKPAKSPSLKGYPDCDQTVQAIADEVWGDCDGRKVTSHAYGKGRIVWGGSLADAIGAAPDFLSDDSNLRFIHRRDGAAEIYFVSNQRDQATVANCTFRVDGLVPELWHPDTGRQEALAMYQASDGNVTVPLQLDPFGSVFVVFRRPTKKAESIVTVRRDGEPIPLDATGAAGQSEILGMPIVEDGKIELTVLQAGNYSLTTSAGQSLTASTGEIPSPQELTGPWRIEFPPKLGAPPSATFVRLMSWTESRDDGIKHFSGTAEYTKTITLSEDQLRPGTRLFLELGEVKNLAEVRLNGRNLGILWKPPFRVEITDAARAGENQLDIQVTNLWPNRLIGDQHLPLSEQITWTTFNPYHADSPLLPSGLLGPVFIRAARQLSIAP